MTVAMEWLVALVFISIPVAALALVYMASMGRLVRCPETSGLGLVELEPSPAWKAGQAALKVRRCDLWPRRCGQGCLARCEGAGPYRVVGPQFLRRLPPA